MVFEACPVESGSSLDTVSWPYGLIAQAVVLKILGKIPSVTKFELIITLTDKVSELWYQTEKKRLFRTIV